jgi:hypothetical protein
MPQTYSFKIETGDVDRVVQTMRPVGASSEDVQRSFNSLINSSPQLASSMARADAAARSVVEQHRQIAVTTTETSRNFGGMSLRRNSSTSQQHGDGKSERVFVDSKTVHVHPRESTGELRAGHDRRRTFAIPNERGVMMA